jgi:hypothetical protein
LASDGDLFVTKRAEESPEAEAFEGADGGVGHIRHSPFNWPMTRPAINNSADAAPAISRNCSTDIGRLLIA